MTTPTTLTGETTLDLQEMSGLQLLGAMTRAFADNDQVTFDRCRELLNRQIEAEDAALRPGDFADDGYGANELGGIAR